MARVTARLLALSCQRDRREELRKLGAEAGSSDLSVWQVRVDGVRRLDALSAMCRASGVECVVGHGTEDGAAIITATARQMRGLVSKLGASMVGELREAGLEIERVIEAAARSPNLRWVCRGQEMALGQRTLVMGIINVTPDSFSGDGLAGRVDAAVSQGVAFVEAGADILDVGGESTRPGSDPVSAEEELSRVSDVIRELSGAVDVPISIDTQKPVVAKRAIELGASIVNDVYGLRAPGMLDVVADAGVGVVIMHMLGQPKTMQVAPRYGDFMKEICDFLRERIEAATAAGVDFEAIAVDPGFGFGKTVGHNLEMLRRLRELHSLGRPVVIGTSRKSTIGLVLDKPVEERLWGTAATCAIAIANGAHVIRVHDVREMVDVARMSDAVVYGWEHDDTS